MEPAADPSLSPYLLALQDGISLQEKDGTAVISSPGRAVPLQRLSPGILAALSRLAAGGATEDEMVAAALTREPAAPLPLMFFYLGRLKNLGLLTFSVRQAGALLCTLTPLPNRSSRGKIAPAALAPGERYVLSRFAMIRLHDGRLRVESPLAPGVVVLHDPRALAVYHALAEPRTVAEISELFPEAPHVVGLLVGCGAATPSGSADESADTSLSMWSFHDLMLHTRSRWGRNEESVGGTFRFAGKLDPLPAVKPAKDAPRIDLHRPDVEALKSSDIPFTRVLEERRSIRAHGALPIPLHQIGELLFRAARVRAFGTSTEGPTYPITNRPYAGGGACYELEVYLAVGACEGLAPGLYHYEPHEHALTGLMGAEQAVEGLLEGARFAMAAASPPQVLLVLTARFGRVMWKYESMAYATILKDVGAFYQTVYLVATAMGLAPCAVGSGDSDLFAAAAGLDYYAETSVGEMALGSRPA